MKLLQVEATNFASYNTISFSFIDTGLCLIKGDTGSGKSTLCDVVPWILYGITAKDGAADDVISWQNKEGTSGILTLEAFNQIITITRVRSKQKGNDLYFTTDNSESIRGKDIPDTQMMINSLLGSPDTYLTGSYLSEFSKTASFFTANAKNRRLILEQLVDTKYADNIKDKTTELKKQHKLELDKQSTNYKAYIEKIEDTKENIAEYAKNNDAFDKIKKDTIIRAQNNMANFNKTRSEEIINNRQKLVEYEDEIWLAGVQLTELSTQQHTCTHCGAIKDSDIRTNIETLKYKVANLTGKKESIQKKLADLKLANNPYTQQVDSAMNMTNVYEDSIDKELAKLDKYTEYAVRAKELLNKQIEAINDSDVLITACLEYRRLLISNIVSFVQDNTNALLSEHFDAEIKMTLEADGPDKLTAALFKDDNACVYAQLSKGQRQLLKLCFGISVMKAVRNSSGRDYNTLFLDEALDGLDDKLKVKSYGLLEKLALDYENILVVEHSSALKERFLNQYLVTLENGVSNINAQS